MKIKNSQKIYLFFLLITLLFTKIKKDFPTTKDEEKKTSSLAPFFYQQIEEDFSLVASPITNLAIDKTWNLLKEKKDFIRYKYTDNHLYCSTNPTTFKNPRKIVITNALKNVLKKDHHLDCIIYLGDQSNLNPSKIFCPIFSFTKNKKENHLLLIPDCEALNPTDRKFLVSLMKKGEKEHPWESKKERLFWRGSPTGNPTFSLSSRLHLATLSRKNPALIDAAIVNFSKELKKKYLEANFGETIHPLDHLAYKYLIDIDGNSCCFSRTFWILLSNSVMFKEASENIQWFYKGLIPYEHYIPIDSDCKNLIERIHFCQTHDEEIKKIAMQATDFALNHLQYETNIEYLSLVLENYRQKLSEKPKITKEDQEIRDDWSDNLYLSLKSFFRKKLKKQPIASALLPMRIYTILNSLLFSLSELNSKLEIGELLLSERLDDRSNPYSKRLLVSSSLKSSKEDSLLNSKSSEQRFSKSNDSSSL